MLIKSFIQARLDKISHNGASFSHDSLMSNILPALLEKKSEILL